MVVGPDRNVTSGDPTDVAASRWRQQLLDLTGSETRASAWRHRRYRFAHRLGEQLVAAQSDVPALRGHAVYGVWLDWGVLYVGQTQNAERRLRDLPIGESHHLSNTFPPEIWSRVVVVGWPALPESAAVAADIPRAEIGLALEHRLQDRLQPLANASRRRADGTFADVNRAASRSVGARRASDIDVLFDAVWRAWEIAVSASTTETTSVWRAVLPPELL